VLNLEPVILSPSFCLFLFLIKPVISLPLSVHLSLCLFLPLSRTRFCLISADHSPLSFCRKKETKRERERERNRKRQIDRKRKENDRLKSSKIRERRVKLIFNFYFIFQHFQFYLLPQLEDKKNLKFEEMLIFKLGLFFEQLFFLKNGH